MKKILYIFVLAIASTFAQAQVKVGANPNTISTSAVLDVEGTSGAHTVILQDGKMGVGTTTPDASSQLDVWSQNKGFLPPRMTTSQRDAIASPAQGLIIYNTDESCINYRKGTNWVSLCGGGGGALLSSLDCSSTTYSPASSTQSVPYSGTMTIPYTSSNGGAYSAQSFTQNGLTFSLPAGNFTSGNGNLVYSISGTPIAAGTTTFALSIGGQGCTLSMPVQTNFATLYASLPAGSGTLSGKSCFDVVMSSQSAGCGTLTSRASLKSDFSNSATNTQTYTFTPTGIVNNVRFAYINTNGSVITGITGGNSGNNISSPVTATVSYNPSLNTLASGLSRSAALTSTIYVIYNDGATDKTLKLTVKVQDCSCCGAYVAQGVWKEFMCHNLGANESADPFTISSAIWGAKYQWGQSTPVFTQAQDQANTGVMSYTFVTPQTDLWQDDIKTVNDPCPPGYKVPSAAQMQGLLNYNTVTVTDGSTSLNNGGGIRFGDSLFLPGAGYRRPDTGLILPYLLYWTSTHDYSSFYNYLERNNGSNPVVGRNAPSYVIPVRCIAQ